jgi:hypothetical protein
MDNLGKHEGPQRETGSSFRWDARLDAGIGWTESGGRREMAAKSSESSGQQHQLERHREWEQVEAGITCIN